MDTINNIARKTNVEADQVLVIFCFLICIFLSFFLRFIENARYRLWYSIIFAISLQFFLYGVRGFDVIFANVGCILVILIFPRKYVGISNNILVCLHLFYIHYERMVNDYGAWRMEISFAFMLTLERWSAYSFNYSDGGDEALSKGNPYAIKEFKLVEFLSYTYFLPSSITGPFAEYNDYMDFIHQKNNYEKIRYNYMIVVRKLALIIFLFVVYSKIKDILCINYFIEQFDSLNRNSGIIDYLRTFLIYLLIYNSKIKYYIGFIFTECACDVSGISYDSTKENTPEAYSKVQCIRFIDCETTFTIKDFFRCWNIATHNWLKRYVFKRIIGTVGKNKAEIITFITSGIWHGFYPSYHIVFGMIILGQNAQSKLLSARSVIAEKIEIQYKRIILLVFDFVYYMLFLISYSYMVVVLDTLKFGLLIDITRRLYFFPILSFVSFCILGHSLDKIFKKDKKKAN